jgi:formate dehydrogenase major subunit
MKITINNQQIITQPGKTILQAALENNIEIPALCHDDRVGEYGSCGICMVEIEQTAAGGGLKLVRSCSVTATDGMVIFTQSERVRKNRELVLELLLSDHTGDCKPPCSLACPAESDCQGYVKLIAAGDFSKAAARIREKIPFPASIGRICPHPCETACRRQLVDEPISIAKLKQYIGDACEGVNPAADGHTTTSGSVAVIGGGPGGLSAAYYLSLKGHAVTVYEAMPHMGGMLRYGVPEFRLPKDVLQKEIALIGQTGINFKNNRRVCIDDVQGRYDAVIVAIGAWNSVKLNLADEIGAIDYLTGRARITPGCIAAVIGGGNTAMDTCRTAIRQGAKKVYCVYRRRREDMPAAIHEIEDAEKEGVIFMFSTTPKQLEPGFADVIISAIGQKPNLNGFEGLKTTERGTIVTDEHTFRTNLENVFAIGDATNKGTDIAARAIGEGRKCALAVDRFLKGQQIGINPAFLVKSEKTSSDFAHYKKQPRCIDEKQEASRCLECGCGVFREHALDSDCKLIKYANQYGVTGRLHGEKHNRKCILCGLCVRINEETIGFTGRGFNTQVKPAGDITPYKNQLLEICPTGAMYDITAI